MLTFKAMGMSDHTNHRLTHLNLAKTQAPRPANTHAPRTVLTLKAMGINDLLGFDFMDPPPASTLVSNTFVIIFSQMHSSVRMRGH